MNYIDFFARSLRLYSVLNRKTLKSHGKTKIIAKIITLYPPTPLKITKKKCYMYKKIPSGVIINVSISPTIFATRNKVLIERLSWTGKAVSTSDSHTKGVTASNPNP